VLSLLAGFGLTIVSAVPASALVLPTVSYRTYGLTSTIAGPVVPEGTQAGTAGAPLRAIMITTNGIECSPYVEGLGWTAWVGANVLCGSATTGKRLLAVKLRAAATFPNWSVFYQTYLGSGWQAEVRDSGVSGTPVVTPTGHLDAIKVRITEKQIRFGVTENDYPWPYANDYKHVYYIDPSLASRATAIDQAMAVLDTSSDIAVQKSALSAPIDVKFKAGSLSGAYAVTGCVSGSTSVCMQWDITRDTSKSHPDEYALFCHEAGHSIGFAHGIRTDSNKDYSSIDQTCLRGNPDVRKYANVDISRINARY
jgi:hypothetical protein